MDAWGQSFAEFYDGFSDNLKTFLTTLVVAIPIVLAVGLAGGLFYLRRRESADRAEPGQPSERDAIAREFVLPKHLDRTKFETAASRARSSIWRTQLHNPAIGLKNKYYEIIGRCGFLLASVFVLLALELTVLRTQTQLQSYFATIDVFAIGLILMFWWRARVTNQAWIGRRITSELMRQWLHMVFVFSWPEIEVEREFKETSKRLESAFVQPCSKMKRWLGFALSPNELESRINDYWHDWRERLRAQAPRPESPQSNPAFAMYLAAGPISQLQWYRMRKRQFAHAGARRGMTMLILFIFSFCLAVMNVLVHWLKADQTPWPSSSPVIIEDWLNLGLLIATAISAALTYWYVSRNERSISHRYGTQTREIEAWLTGMAGLLAAGQSGPTYEHVLEFEDLMVSELIDWVHITSHDVVELGP